MPEDNKPDVEEVDDDLDTDKDLDKDIDTEDEDGDEEWTPPSKEDWTKLTNAARARKEDIKTLRRELGELKAKSTKKDDEEEDSGDSEAKKWRTTAARSSAATALSAAGFSGTAKQARRLTRLLDLEGAEPDDLGDFDFDDDIEELKEEFPQLFEPADEGRGRRAPRVTTSDRGRKSSTVTRDKTSERLLKQGGYH